MSRLIITNGYSAEEAIAAAGIEGTTLSWRDVLHDGPVPGGLPLEHLSAIRARFIAACGWGSVDGIRRHFRERDDVVATAADAFDEIVLWFEHDLYDQLQMLQVLSLYADPTGDSGSLSRTTAKTTLICHDHFVSMTDAETLRTDFDRRIAVGQGHIEEAHAAWQAFGRHTPLEMENMVRERDSWFHPYLKAALYRWFEEFPNPQNGLNRVEQSALEFIRAEEGARAGPLFQFVTGREAAPFMGDASFWLVMERLTGGFDPLVQTQSGIPFDSLNPGGTHFHLTPAGEALLDTPPIRPPFVGERWMGGIHLRPGYGWTWDVSSGEFIHTTTES